MSLAFASLSSEFTSLSSEFASLLFEIEENLSKKKSKLIDTTLTLLSEDFAMSSTSKLSFSLSIKYSQYSQFDLRDLSAKQINELLIYFKYIKDLDIRIWVFYFKTMFTFTLSIDNSLSDRNMNLIYFEYINVLSTNFKMLKNQNILLTYFHKIRFRVIQSHLIDNTFEIY